ncbi:MAG: hypothetical protein JW966_15390 [Anaerolineae bacterium]|nr:hypothetical protein [Anaerolineae bacterium]
MNQTWYSLYVPASDTDTVSKTLGSLFGEHGYQPYDPFPGGTGTPSGQRELVRLFVAPAQENWVRVLGQPVESLLPDFSRAMHMPVIYGWLTGDDGGLALFTENGTRHTDPAAFEPFLKPDTGADLLERAFAGKLPVPVQKDDGPPVAVIGGDALPPEIQQLAEDKGVNPQQANKLFERLSGSLFGKLGGSDDQAQQDQARAIVSGGGRNIWNSLNGQRVRAAASVLQLPANWQVPTAQTVRDAYQVHRLRERSPRMALLPGDKDVMDAVPDALSYVPVYVVAQS